MSLQLFLSNVLCVHPLISVHEQVSLYHNRTLFASNLKRVCDDTQIDYGSTTNIS